MNKIDFSQPNGFPLKADTLGFMQGSYTSAIHALCKLAGESSVILEGCNLVSGNTIANGYVYFQNEIFYFEGGVAQSDFIIFEQITADNNQNGTSVNRYFERILKFGSGANSFPFSSLLRIESLLSLTQKSIFFLLEKEVIIHGCDVVINGTDVEISEGVAMISDKYVNIPSYFGAFPVYFHNGAWTNVASTADYLEFTPDTHQRLASVYKRATTPSGEILLRGVNLNDFDSTGLGLWGYKGFAICNGNNGTYDLRGRTVVGYDERPNDPNNNIWDADYNVIGAQGGEKEHVLSIQEMPRHNHNAEGDPSGAKYQDALAGDFALVQKSTTGQNRVTNSLSTLNSGSKPDVVTSPAYIPFQGQNQPHENRPPFIVLAYLQRI